MTQEESDAIIASLNGLRSDIEEFADATYAAIDGLIAIVEGMVDEPEPRLPGAPRNVVATPGNGQLTVTWEPPTDVGSSPLTTYRIKANGVFVEQRVASDPRLKVITGLVNGTAYTVTIEAISQAGVGPAGSATATPVAPPVSTPPGAPTSVAAAAGSAGATAVLTWAAPASSGTKPITGYRVRRKAFTVGSTTTPEWTAIVGPSVLTQTFTAIPNGTAVHYSVNAITDVGEGPEVDVALTLTGTTLPSSPQNVALNVGTPGQATISWDAPANNGGSAITGYKVGRPATGESWTVSAATLSRTIAGLAAGPVTLRVRAINAVGEGPYVEVSGTVTSQPSTPTLPAARTGLSVAISGTTATLTWSNPAGGPTVTGQSLYLDGAYYGWRPAGETTGVFTAVPAGTHTFGVNAFAGAGNDGPIASVPGTIGGPPPNDPPPPPGGAANLAVNVSVLGKATARNRLGACSTTYGVLPTESAAQAQIEENLDMGAVRIPIRLVNGRIESSAGGAGGKDLKPLIDWYRNRGIKCILVFAGGAGNDWGTWNTGVFAAAKAILGTNLVEYTTPNEFALAGAGNHTIADVVTRANQMYAESGPVVKISGPVHHMFNRAEIKAFMQGTGPVKCGNPDYHRYGMGDSWLSTADLLASTPRWGQDVDEILADAASLGITCVPTCDEANLSYRKNDGTPLAQGGNGSGVNLRFHTAVNTVFLASIIGHNLSHGGAILPYGLQNGALGLTYEKPLGDENPDGRAISSPMPGYYGVGVWTGMKLFPHFKDRFYQATSNDPLTEVFAVNNEAGGYNIVVINKRENDSKEVYLTVPGVQGTAKRWATLKSAQYAAPTVQGGTINLDGTAPVQFTAGPLSVNVLVVSPFDGGGTPTTLIGDPGAVSGFSRSAAGAIVEDWTRGDVPEGSWDSSVYARAFDAPWTPGKYPSYPGENDPGNGGPWPDTARKNNFPGGYYDSNRVNRVQGGVFIARQHVAAGKRWSSNVQLAPYARGGRIIARFKIVNAGTHWKMAAPLAWPQEENGYPWPEFGEIDVVEGGYEGGSMASFLHIQNGSDNGSDQLYWDLGNLADGQWHVLDARWKVDQATPANNRYEVWIDGTKRGEATDPLKVPRGPMRWQWQLETEIDNVTATGQAEVHQDWFVWEPQV